MNVSEGKIILADSLEFWQKTNDAYFIHVPMMIISTLTRLAAADHGVYQRYPRKIFNKMLLCNKILVISNSFHGLIRFWHRKVRACVVGGAPGEAGTPYYEQRKMGSISVSGKLPSQPLP